MRSEQPKRPRHSRQVVEDAEARPDHASTNPGAVQGTGEATPLDLSTKVLDVRRLAKANPSFRAAVERGYDPDELLQEVWVTVLSRQAGPTPYDPKRASFSKWVWQVTRSAVSHLQERTGNRARHEQTGRRDMEDAETDAALWAQDHEAADLNDDEQAAVLAALDIDPHSEVARFLLAGNTIAKARRHFGPRWAREIDRIAKRIEDALEEIQRERGEAEGGR